MPAGISQAADGGGLFVLGAQCFTGFRIDQVGLATGRADDCHKSLAAGLRWIVRDEGLHAEAGNRAAIHNRCHTS